MANTTGKRFDIEDLTNQIISYQKRMLKEKNKKYTIRQLFEKFWFAGWTYFMMIRRWVASKRSIERLKKYGIYLLIKD